ncbi:WD40 repeat domain-containing protein [Streptomyces sp. NBC_01275]|uniref:WD40 repeat domain-containing protein n=1 Tax=Streptomyces sp. NBC_01275 TaxID=2903807 RepID=UPI0022581658|nr:WD40 repeat domain-containing protein [Streptomyces sp. NBC_01275]MCX4761109.1 WD40 repeat domain-containing protein [Streptomyces sp. NBC_01275]
MNVDELVRDSLREQADQQIPAVAGLADRVLALRRRRRTRRIASVAAATAAVVAVAVAVPLLKPGGTTDVRPADVMEPDRITAHPDQSPPRDLIAAGRTALAAYFSRAVVPVPHTADQAISTHTYWLLNPTTKKYVKTTKWSWVAVAPGLQTAAVLEQNLPAHRIGLLDLASGEVKRWIPVDHTVGGLAFSGDGSKLVATTYSANPDLVITPKDDSEGEQPVVEQSHRTGFYVLDVASGQGSWSEVQSGDPNDPSSFLNSRQDFAFSRDGGLVWSGLPSEPGYQYYDLKGRQVDAPADGKHVQWYVDAGFSPDGTKLAGDFAGKKYKTSSWIVDPRTGKNLTETHGQQLLAWADDSSLVAWDIGKDGNEFHQRLVLVTLNSDKVVPLSDFRATKDNTPGRWEPVFADR